MHMYGFMFICRVTDKKANLPVHCVHCVHRVHRVHRVLRWVPTSHGLRSTMLDGRKGSCPGPDALPRITNQLQPVQVSRLSTRQLAYEKKLIACVSHAVVLYDIGRGRRRGYIKYIWMSLFGTPGKVREVTLHHVL